MAKKNRNIHNHQKTPFIHHPLFQVVQGASSSAFAEDTLHRIQDGRWRMTQIAQKQSQGRPLNTKTPWHSSKIVGENAWASHRGVIPGWFHTTNAGFFWGKEVTQEFKVEYVALLRLFINSFSLWMPAMKSSFLQWSRTNHYQLQLSWGLVGSSNKKKLGVEAQI